MNRDLKVHARIVIVTIISALELDDIQRIIESETKWKEFLDMMIGQVLKIFPNLTINKVKEFIESYIGNVGKSYANLQDKQLEGIDTAKLKLWREVWAREKDKTMHANDLDTHFELSNKKQAFQAAFVEGFLSAASLSKEEALLKTELNSQSTSTIGIPKEAIFIISKLGSDAYGTLSKFQIKKISFLP